MTASEIFRLQAPYYLSIGVPYDLYWGSNDPEILREYIEADKNRQERDNNNAWLYGAYFAKSIEATIGNAFRTKGSQPAKYPAEPIQIIKRDAEQEKSEKQEEQEALFSKAYMMQMVRAGKNWGKK